MKKSIWNFPFHPLLFGIYPALFLLSQNLGGIQPYTIARSLVVSLLAAGLVLVLNWRIYGGWRRAGLVTSAFLVLFFSYGHVVEWLAGVGLFASALVRELAVLALWLVLLLDAVYFFGKRLKDTAGLNSILNLSGAGLVAVVLLQIFVLHSSYVKTTGPQVQAQMRQLGISTVTGQLSPPHLSRTPDVYYIILDGYSRADVLMDEYGYDNAPFLQELEKRGFYVARCARSNYPITVFSLGSSLNLQLLHPFASDFFTRAQSWENFGVYMRESGARYTFEELGYRSVTFDTGFNFASVTNASVYYSLDQPLTLEDLSQKGMNGFEQMLMRTTLIGGINPVISSLSGSGVPVTGEPALAGEKTWATNENRLYDMFVYDLDRLENEVPRLAGRKFVFAHLVTTHKPFLFAPDGSFLMGGDSNQGYVDSIEFTNGRLLEIVDSILARSETPPVIILQGDHARPEGQDKNSILSAYYLPGGGNRELYPNITPVNTFRVVFNRYFGAHLPLLPDTVYKATPVNGIYQFEPIEESYEGCK